MISVSLDGQGYPPVPRVSVTLNVLEPLFVEPPFLRAPPYSEINFGLRIIKPRVRKKLALYEDSTPFAYISQLTVASSPLVTLPSPHFTWKPQYEKVDTHPFYLSDGLQFLAVDPGSGRTFINTTKSAVSRVVVIDNRIENNRAAAIVEVSPLSRLDLCVSPKLPVSADRAKEAHGEVQQLSKKIGTQLTNWESGLHFPFSTLLSTTEAFNDPLMSQTWVLIRGNRYILGGLGFDQSGYELYIPSNFAFDLSCKKEAGEFVRIKNVKTTVMVGCERFEPLWISESERFLVFEASQFGRGSLKMSTRQRSIRTPADALLGLISVEKEFLIVERIGLRNRPPYLGQPVYPPVILPVGHSWTFEAVGGSGSYIWLNSNSSVAQIIPSPWSESSAVILASAFGSAKITLCDANNRDNLYEFIVIVAPVSRLLLDPHQIQISAGDDAEVIHSFEPVL